MIVGIFMNKTSGDPTGDVSEGVNRSGDDLVEKHFLKHVSPGILNKPTVKKGVPDMSFDAHHSPRHARSV